MNILNTRALIRHYLWMCYTGEIGRISIKVTNKTGRLTVSSASHIFRGSSLWTKTRRWNKQLKTNAEKQHLSLLLGMIVQLENLNTIMTVADLR